MMMKKLATAAFAVAALATLSVAASGDAFARGGSGGGRSMGSAHMGVGAGKFVGGGKIIVGGGKFSGYRWHHHHRFYGFGYGYSPCWKWTPTGWVNVCLAAY
jgi:hypothetical protein